MHTWLYVFVFLVLFVVFWQITVIKWDSQLPRIQLDKVMAVIKTTVVWGKCKVLVNEESYTEHC
jgi:ABC-type sulfate transport system permease component